MNLAIETVHIEISQGAQVFFLSRVCVFNYAANWSYMSYKAYVRQLSV